MTDEKDQYIETTNLYWEMLWKAQKVEDRKLVSLLHDRLAALPRETRQTIGGCAILTFPAHRPLAAAPLSPAPQETTTGFWPAQPIAATLSFLAAYCLITLSAIVGT